MTTRRRYGWTARSVHILAVFLTTLGLTACGDDEDSPTAPGSPDLSGDYQLGIRASESCGNDLGAGRTQGFDATITESGSNVVVTLVHDQGLPTAGEFAGILEGSTIQVEGTVDVVPSQGNDYHASGTMIGPVSEDQIRALFGGTIRLGAATCSAADHTAVFTRD